MRAARLLNKLMILYVCFFFLENAFYYVIVFVFEYNDVAVQEILFSVFTILMVLEVRLSVPRKTFIAPILLLSMAMDFTSLQS